MKSDTKKTTFAGGCYWCTEAIFNKIRGVTKVTPGFSGGTTKNPTYKEVSLGNTGHAESIQIEFDPEKIQYKDLLYIFFKTHDPTTLDRQGADVGKQYRSVIFYHSLKQKEEAEKQKKNMQTDFKDLIVTEIVPFESFHEAPRDHKDYYDKNKGNTYCSLVIDPKIKKLENDFGDYLKKQEN